MRYIKLLQDYLRVNSNFSPMELDITAIIGAASAVIIAMTPIIVKYYTQSQRYLELVVTFLDMVNEYYKSKSDGNFTDEEYKEIGKKAVAFASKVHNDTTVPAELDDAQRALK